LAAFVRLSILCFYFRQPAPALFGASTLGFRVARSLCFAQIILAYALFCLRAPRHVLVHAGDTKEAAGMQALQLAKSITFLLFPCLSALFLRTAFVICTLLFARTALCFFSLAQAPLFRFGGALTFSVIDNTSGPDKVRCRRAQRSRAHPCRDAVDPAQSAHREVECVVIAAALC
jgi:hypothetical protein